MNTQSKVGQRNDMESYFIPQWPVPSHIRSFVTTRCGGFSQGNYQSFNLGLSSGDNPKDVRLNREKMQSDWDWKQPPLWVRQVHGTKVVYASEDDHTIQADGVWTDKQQTVCLILTADCLPVLLCHKTGSCVAAVHAGWKGLAAGVLESALHLLPDTPDNMMAFLGPAIGPACFEVGPEVRDTFLAEVPESEKAFIAGKGDRWQADLYHLARLRLEKNGLTAIYGGDCCTFTEEERFYSYRRDGKLSGRIASAIWLE
ncbi:Laccase domain protein YfiH [invertebrate metagenome]|uniref:Laccase domain protein YfiH n=1 Tax=invertebrate metagenome TaxID=1711999 RepID=A0A2H9TAV1_9ZZZZ